MRHSIATKGLLWLTHSQSSISSFLIKSILFLGDISFRSSGCSVNFSSFKCLVLVVAVHNTCFFVSSSCMRSRQSAVSVRAILFMWSLSLQWPVSRSTKAFSCDLQRLSVFCGARKTGQILVGCLSLVVYQKSSVN